METKIEFPVSEEDDQLEELLQEKLRIESELKALQEKLQVRQREAVSEEASTVGEPDDDSGGSSSGSVASGVTVVTINRPSTSTADLDESDLEDEATGYSTTPSNEALQLLHEIRGLPPPKLKLTKPIKISAADVRAENVLRNRIPSNRTRSSKLANQLGRSTDNADAQIAPSVMVRPLPFDKMPSFDDVLKELNVSDLVNPANKQQPLYLVDCRIISQTLLKKLICKRAESLVAKTESTKVDRGTQTFVTTVGKQYVAGCVNCRSRDHHFKECKLPYRPGFCQICGADGFDTNDCIYPHGIEHEYALGRCLGCARDLSLYCPECPDCNIRYEGIVDWLRLNYATWPTSWVPEDHQYMINQGKETLKRKCKAKFDDPSDYANRARAFLIRENALFATQTLKNPAAETALQMSIKKRQRAIQALYSPLIEKSLDQVMAERPEINNGEEIRVIIPTKYKK